MLLLFASVLPCLCCRFSIGQYNPIIAPVCKALAVKAPVAGEAAIAARVQEAANALIRAPTAAAKTFPVIAKAAKQKRA